MSVALAKQHTLPDDPADWPDDWPTTLPPAGRKLAAVLADPQTANMTVLQICNSAGVSQEAYYWYMRQKEFATYCRVMRAHAVQQFAAGIIAARAAVALSADPRAHNDAAMLLQMAGDMPLPGSQIQAPALNISISVESGGVAGVALSAPSMAGTGSALAPAIDPHPLAALPGPGPGPGPDPLALVAP